MRSVFKELDVNNDDVLTLDEVISENARRKLSQRLPRLFGTVGPTGERQDATAHDVISKLDPSGTGEVTVLDFMRAAREMAGRKANAAGGSVSSQGWHNFPRQRADHAAATDGLRRSGSVSNLIDAANSKNASRATSSGDGPSPPVSPLPAKPVVTTPFAAKPLVTISSIMAGTNPGGGRRFKSIKPKKVTIAEPDAVPSDGEGYLVLESQIPPAPREGEPPHDGADTFTRSQENNQLDSQSLARSVTLLNMNYDVSMLTQEELGERISGHELKAGLPMALQQLGRSDEGIGQAPALIDMMEKQDDGAVTVQEFLRVTQPVWRVAMGSGPADPRTAHFVPASFHN